MRFLTPTSIAIAVAACLGVSLGGLAIAQSGPPTAAQQKQLEAARAQLDQAAKRYAELAREYGIGPDPIRIEKRVLRKPVLGVLLSPDGAAGVRIAGVTPRSAASEAGLRGGDRLVSIDGQRIRGDDGEARVEHARELLDDLRPDTPVRLAYARGDREATVTVKPRIGDRLLFLPDGGGMPVVELDEDRVRIINERAQAGVEAGRAYEEAMRSSGRAKVARDRAEWSAAIAPGIRHEIIRLDGDCKGDHCKVPMLAEALRWNGLNLASVDEALGRYFGTTRGVLVLSTSPEFAGLQAGDVIREIGGEAVATPRDAMDALRARPADSRVEINYLRDRKPATTQVTVPKVQPLRIPLPPAPPAPPHAPPPPEPMRAPAPPAPPHAPPPPEPMHAPAPPAPPAPPPPPPLAWQGTAFDVL